MKKSAAVFMVLTSLALEPQITQADSLSAALGATKLDGLSKFTKCQNESYGFRERLIADRLELKLANTPNLSLEVRGQWLAEINALRQVQQLRKPFTPPNSQDPQHYMLGLTDKEQVSINSQNTRFIQEVNLKCEQQYGGMTRYSPTSDQSGQVRYENQLRAQMAQPVLSLENIPVEPLPSLVQKTPAEIAQEKKTEQAALQQAAMQKFRQCSDAGKGLRVKLVAQALQQKLDVAADLSEKDRAEFQADVQSAWASAGKGLDMIESADPKNPMRAEMRLTPQEQMEINSQYSQQFAQLAQNCIAQAR